MTARRHSSKPASQFTTGGLVNLFVLIFGFLASAFGFYFGTRDHFDILDKTTAQVQVDVKSSTENLQKLITQFAVQDQQEKQVIATLDKISAQVELLRASKR